MENSFGKHYIAELINCNQQAISFVKEVEKALIEAVNAAGATYINHISHQFQPQGVSVIVMLAESHITAHTWPESSYAAIDIFTCSDNMSADKALEVIKEKFSASEIKGQEITRGF